MRIFTCLVFALCFGFLSNDSFAAIITSKTYVDNAVNQITQELSSVAEIVDTALQSEDLSGYATQSWVLAQGYSTGVDENGNVPATEANVNALQTSILTHIDDASNPHDVGKTQIGLSNVPNVDTTNAANITSGIIGFTHLPIGTTATSVAAGNDARFAEIENKVDATDLGTSAYTDSSAYATAAQGALADTALQESDVADLRSLLDLGSYIGTAATKSQLPSTIAAAKTLWGDNITPTVNDFSDVLVDESRDGANDSYRITSINAGVITWGAEPFRIYTQDTTGLMSRQAGATSGHIATFDSSGGVTDSGHTTDEFATDADIATAVSTKVDADDLGQGAFDDIGTTSGTIAAGDDGRFDTIPTSMPSSQLQPGRAFIWIE
ncbi:MAG: hypothetical protein LBL75_03645 [Rickettsiales bacterium]|nr:hypothetical protein [Rickettsiales bacterium]